MSKAATNYRLNEDCALSYQQLLRDTVAWTGARAGEGWLDLGRGGARSLTRPCSRSVVKERCRQPVSPRWRIW